MKGAIIIASFLAGLATAASNATRTDFRVKTAVAVAAKATATPWSFQLQASDGTWLGLSYASDGAYLFPEPSDYTFTLDNTTLRSSSTDILCGYSGDETIGVNFVQPDVGLEPLVCKTTGKWPDIQLSCTLDGYRTYGDYSGELVFGQGSAVKASGATLIQFTVYPACDYPGTAQ